MSFTRLSGSGSALSVAAAGVESPLGITTLTAAGVLVTYKGAQFIHKKYTQYKDKKQIEAIREVNALHSRHFSCIKDPNGLDVPGFPIIFQLDKEKPDDPSLVTSLRFNEDEIRKCGNATFSDSEVGLTQYRDEISNAMKKIKAYYLDRHTDTDITADVLAYLLYMLETKCHSFQGYDVDIAYLEVIKNFINDFASKEGNENTPGFTRLSKACRHLEMARKELHKHKESLSLKSIVGHLSNTCIDQSKDLLEVFAKLIVQYQHWEFVENSTHQELLDGILRQQYTRKTFMGLALKNDNKIEINKSHFYVWLVELLEFYKGSINPNSTMSKGKIKSPDEIFYLPDLKKLSQAKNAHRKSKEDKEDIERNDKMLDSIREVFSQCDNFITRKLDIKTINDKPAYVLIKEDEEIIERSGTVKLLATLTHQMLSLQYFCIFLLKSIEQLGEIYCKNPANFKTIFDVLNSLSSHISKSSDLLIASIDAIKEGNKHIFRLQPQEQFLNDTRQLLEEVKKSVSINSGKIEEYRNKVPTYYDAVKAAEDVKQDMYEVATFMNHIHELNVRFTPEPSMTPLATLVPIPFPLIPIAQGRTSSLGLLASPVTKRTKTPSQVSLSSSEDSNLSTHSDSSSPRVLMHNRARSESLLGAQPSIHVAASTLSARADD